MRQNFPVSQREFALPPNQSLVSVTDPQGRITYCNGAFIAVSGFTREELLGQPHNLVRHPDMPAEAFRDMWATLETGQPWSGIVKNRRKNGDHYWVFANATPMRDGERVTGYLSVRVPATRAQIEQAGALYERMRNDSSITLTAGQLAPRGLPGRAQRLLGGLAWRPMLLQLGAMGLSVIAACAGSWRAGLPVALLLTLGLNWYAAYVRRQGSRDLLAETYRMAAGDLSRDLDVRENAELVAIERALHQLEVNLRSVVRDTRQEIIHVRRTAEQIASGNRDLSARTESQASALEQTTAAIHEMRDTLAHSADSAAGGARLAGTMKELAARSSEAVTAIGSTMQQLADSANRIAEFSHIIEGVAFQTNILALNAAVEAARAGDAGRGFAVVAQEVRALAQRTAEAARQIKQLAALSNEHVRSGSAQSQAAVGRMAETMRSIHEVSAMLEGISRDALSQQDGITQIDAAISELDQVTQQNARMVEQLAEAAAALDAEVAAVDDAMSLFRLRAGERTASERDAVGLRRQAKTLLKAA